MTMSWKMQVFVDLFNEQFSPNFDTFPFDYQEFKRRCAKVISNKPDVPYELRHNRTPWPKCIQRQLPDPYTHEWSLLKAAKEASFFCRHPQFKLLDTQGPAIPLYVSLIGNTAHESLDDQRLITALNEKQVIEDFLRRDGIDDPRFVQGHKKFGQKGEIDALWFGYRNSEPVWFPVEVKGPVEAPCGLFPFHNQIRILRENHHGHIEPLYLHRHSDNSLHLHHIWIDMVHYMGGTKRSQLYQIHVTG